MITQFVSKSVLHHVGLSWIISSKIKLDMKSKKMVLIDKIKVHGITHTYVIYSMELYLNISLEIL